VDLINEISNIGLTKEQYEECVQLIIDKKNNANDIDWQEICDRYSLPISSDTLRKANGTIFGGAFIAEYFQNKNASVANDSIEAVQKSYGAEMTINKDGTYSSNKLLVMNEQESKDPEYILKAHGFDSTCWQIVSARNNIRQVVSKQDGVVTLYASFITVKPIAEKDLPLHKMEEFFNNLDRNYSLPTLKENYMYDKGNKLLLIDIADLHMNLQSSVFTTGNEYNCDIAERLFFYVIEDILTRTQHYNFEEIVFCVGGDMLNGDNLLGSTTKGTMQTSDVHYYDAYERLCAMTIKAIDLLKERCKVNVIYVMGNHDELTGFKLAKYIDAWFRNDDRVYVDYQPMARKYKLYGNTLLCFAHDGKVQKLPAIIADEARQYWSQAETVEVFLQHLHTEQVLLEDNNIRIQRLPTISGRSKWSSDKGYSSKRQCKSFVFDSDDGLTDVLYTPIREVNRD
jgi:hypothetical protein